VKKGVGDGWWPLTQGTRVGCCVGLIYTTAKTYQRHDVYSLSALLVYAIPFRTQFYNFDSQHSCCSVYFEGEKTRVRAKMGNE